MQVITYLKKELPNLEIWVLTKPHSRDLFYKIIDEDKILTTTCITSDRHREKFSIINYFTTLVRIRKERFNSVIDLTGNRYSAVFLFLSGIKKRVGLKDHKFALLYNISAGKFDYSCPSLCRKNPVWYSAIYPPIHTLSMK